jgi:hypothetical protein
MREFFINFDVDMNLGISRNPLVSFQYMKERYCRAQYTGHREYDTCYFINFFILFIFKFISCAKVPRHEMLIFKNKHFCGNVIHGYSCRYSAGLGYELKRKRKIYQNDFKNNDVYGEAVEGTGDKLRSFFD